MTITNAMMRGERHHMSLRSAAWVTGVTPSVSAEQAM
jgi:hypothetical protein